VTHRALRGSATRWITDYDRIGRIEVVHKHVVHLHELQYSGTAAYQPALHTAFVERRILGAELERFSAGMEERLCRE
jgi:hypothetical protein